VKLELDLYLDTNIHATQSLKFFKNHDAEINISQKIQSKRGVNSMNNDLISVKIEHSLYLGQHNTYMPNIKKILKLFKIYAADTYNFTEKSAKKEGITHNNNLIFSQN
jgi:hypothetical protein